MIKTNQEIQHLKGKFHDHLIVKSTNEDKLLGLIIDHKLNFISHINTLCTTANKKLKCLRRIRNYISIPQEKISCNSYIYSTFNY